MTVPLQPEKDAAMADEKKRKLENIQAVYVEHRDDLREQFKALARINGDEAVCVAIHVSNMTRMVVDFLPEGDLQRAFNEELGALVRHWCKYTNTEQELIAKLAMGIYEETGRFVAALEEAGFEGAIPFPGGLTEGDG